MVDGRCSGVQGGRSTTGGFVMSQRLHYPDHQPLNFLGTVYREIRQALVDMGRDVSTCWEQPQEVSEGRARKSLQVTGGEVVFEDVRFSL